jgi:hypothetical protein
MSRLMHRRILRMASLALGAFLPVAPGWLVVCAAQLNERQQSQQPPPPPPQNSEPTSQPAPLPDAPVGKQRRVWTNDDVVQLRTPADNYLVEKEAREAAEAEARAKSAAQPQGAKEAPLEIKLPSSIEETQLLLKNKEQDISDDQAALVSLNTELTNLSDEAKKAKQKEIGIVAAELDRARNELKALQEHLVELHKPPASESTAAPPPPPPQ